MSEFESQPNGIIVEQADIQRVEELFGMIEKGASGAKTADPVEAAFFQAVYPEILDGGRLRPHLDEVFATRRLRQSFYPTGYALRTLEFAVDKQARKLFPEDYPRFFSAPGTWDHHDVFGRLDYYELFQDMQENLRSNISGGYEIFKLLTFVFRDRSKTDPTVVDIGDSLGLGLKKWMMPRQFPFKPIEVLVPPQPGQAISPDLEADRVAQHRVDYMAEVEPVVNLALGCDILPINSHDADAVDLVFSHTFPMSESGRDPGAVREFRSLVQATSPKVKLLDRNIDVTDLESLSQLADYLPNGKADIFTFSAVLFEMPPEKVKSAFANLRPYCNDGALIFGSDFVKVNPDASNGLDFIRGDWWHRLGSFATFIVDPFRLEEPPVEVCRYLTRRCEKMWLTDTGRRLFERVSP